MHKRKISIEDKQRTIYWISYNHNCAYITGHQELSLAYFYLKKFWRGKNNLFLLTKSHVLPTLWKYVCRSALHGCDQNIWHKQLRRGRVFLGSQFRGVVHIHLSPLLWAAHHGRRAWWREAASVIATRKKKEGREGGHRENAPSYPPPSAMPYLPTVITQCIQTKRKWLGSSSHNPITSLLNISALTQELLGDAHIQIIATCKWRKASNKPYKVGQAVHCINMLV